MSRKKKKKKDCKGSTPDIGNPTINVNISTGATEEVLSFVRQSAFRAINLTTNQPVAANTPLKIIFPTEQFDLASEYDPITSTFTPAKNGVYFVLGDVAFSPNDPNGDYRTRIEVRINGKPAVAIDNDFFGAGTPFLNAVSVSTVVMLKAGDRVEVFAESNIPGSFVASEDGSRFEAARFPSPLH
jgi:hypothetical protein